MKRTCIYCSKSIEGRASKKYCDDMCRSANFYEKNKNQESHFIKVQKILRNNRKILKHFNKGGFSSVSADKLAVLGFEPKYFTTYWRAKNGNTYLFVYEFGFRKVIQYNKTKYHLVLWQDYMNMQ